MVRLQGSALRWPFFVMVHFMKRKTNGNGKAAIISELERLANQSDDADNWRALVRSVKDAKTKSHVELEEAILRAAQAMKNVGVLKGINDRSTRKRPVA